MQYINDFEFGRITINTKVFTSDIIIFPEKLAENWWREEGHKLQLNDIQDILEYYPEVFIIGTGTNSMMRVTDAVIQILNKRNIEYHILPTPRAVELHNQLSAKNRVVTALHLTC